MKLLFIKLKHIGDALLLTPTLMAARRAHPTALIWVVVRKGCEDILEGCPAVDRVLTSAAPETENRSGLDWLQDIRLIRQLRAQQFDFAFELSDNSRGRWLAWLSGAHKLCTGDKPRPLNWWWRGRFHHISHQSWKELHRTEKDFFITGEALPLGKNVPPLCFDRSCARPLENLQPKPPFVVFHPGTRWKRKRWPEDRWTEVGKYFSNKGIQIIISSGPDTEEVALAEKLVRAIGHETLTTGGRADWAQLAWLLYQAKLFVGVDTAAMHLAAACQCPTVAIFGPSRISAWKPWQVPHRIVSPPEIPAGLDGAKESGFAKNVSVADVLAACDDLLKAES